MTFVDRDSTNFNQEQDTLVNILTVKNMELELCFILMDPNMKVFLVLIFAFSQLQKELARLFLTIVKTYGIHRENFRL